MTNHASGPFEVKLDPLATDAGAEGAARAGRMAIDIADGKHTYDFEYTL